MFFHPEGFHWFRWDLCGARSFKLGRFHFIAFDDRDHGEDEDDDDDDDADNNIIQLIHRLQNRDEILIPSNSLRGSVFHMKTELWA